MRRAWPVLLLLAAGCAPAGAAKKAAPYDHAAALRQREAAIRECRAKGKSAKGMASHEALAEELVRSFADGDARALIKRARCDFGICHDRLGMCALVAPRVSVPILLRLRPRLLLDEGVWLERMSGKSATYEVAHASTTDRFGFYLTRESGAWLWEAFIFPYDPAERAIETELLKLDTLWPIDKEYRP